MLKKLICSFFAVFVLVWGAESTPRGRRRDESCVLRMTPEIGVISTRSREDVSFVCDASCLGPLSRGQLVWKDQHDNPVPTFGHNRIHTVSYNRWMISRLLVRSALPQDSGVYTCEVQHEGQRLRYTASLQVEEDPKPRPDDGPRRGDIYVEPEPEFGHIRPVREASGARNSQEGLGLVRAPTVIRHVLNLEGDVHHLDEEETAPKSPELVVVNKADDEEEEEGDVVKSEARKAGRRERVRREADAGGAPPPAPPPDPSDTFTMKADDDAFNGTATQGPDNTAMPPMFNASNEPTWNETTASGGDFSSSPPVNGSDITVAIDVPLAPQNDSQSTPWFNQSQADAMLDGVSTEDSSLTEDPPTTSGMLNDFSTPTPSPDAGSKSRTTPKPSSGGGGGGIESSSTPKSSSSPRAESSSTPSSSSPSSSSSTSTSSTSGSGSGSVVGSGSKSSGGSSDDTSTTTTITTTTTTDSPGAIGKSAGAGDGETDFGRYGLVAFCLALAVIFLLLLALLLFFLLPRYCKNRKVFFFTRGHKEEGVKAEPVAEGSGEGNVILLGERPHKPLAPLSSATGLNGEFITSVDLEEEEKKKEKEDGEEPKEGAAAAPAEVEKAEEGEPEKKEPESFVSTFLIGRLSSSKAPEDAPVMSGNTANMEDNVFAPATSTPIIDEEKEKEGKKDDDDDTSSSSSDDRDSEPSSGNNSKDPADDLDPPKAEEQPPKSVDNGGGLMAEIHVHIDPTGGISVEDTHTDV
ncbi:uncharacterized protein LOC143302108 [Babylonia areolata]|uniref:uncharacterized protein LOC143302108 n=1 Tax=Babylonia areolata TaxID=304850 RepID=UPI003FCF8C79